MTSGTFALAPNASATYTDVLGSVFDLGDDHYERYPAVFHEITRGQILRAAREHFHPESLAVVVVGPAAELRPQLEELARRLSDWNAQVRMSR